MGSLERSLKWPLENYFLWGGGNSAMDQHSIQGRVQTPPVTLCSVSLGWMKYKLKTFIFYSNLAYGQNSREETKKRTLPTDV